jgi:hypothetical protein
MAIDFENGGEEVALDAEGVQLDAQGFPPPPTEDGTVDADLNPEKFNALSAAALQLEKSTEDFSITGPPDGKVTLIGGYVADGQRFTDAEVKELTGADEEAIARALASQDMARYVDTLVRVGTVRIGEISDRKELLKALDTLLIGDRDLLIMQIRRSTFGDTMRLDIVCPFCDHEFQVDYSFADDVPLRGLNIEGAGDPMQRLFDIELPSSGSMASIRLMDGTAQKKVYTTDNLTKTAEELNTLMLAELLDNIDGKPVNGPSPVLKMTARDRKKLVEFVSEGQPGPQYLEVKQECPECIREFPLPITTRDMFRGD